MPYPTDEFRIEIRVNQLGLDDKSSNDYAVSVYWATEEEDVPSPGCVVCAPTIEQAFVTLIKNIPKLRKAQALHQQEYETMTQVRAGSLITDDAIRALKERATKEDDPETVHICEVALAEKAPGDGRSWPYSRDDARSACAERIGPRARTESPDDDDPVYGAGSTASRFLPRDDD